MSLKNIYKLSPTCFEGLGTLGWAKYSKSLAGVFSIVSPDQDAIYLDNLTPVRPIEN